MLETSPSTRCINPGRHTVQAPWIGRKHGPRYNVCSALVAPWAHDHRVTISCGGRMACLAIYPFVNSGHLGRSGSPYDPGCGGSANTTARRAAWFADLE